jgi:hypothetical protein
MCLLRVHQYDFRLSLNESRQSIRKPTLVGSSSSFLKINHLAQKRFGYAAKECRALVCKSEHPHPIIDQGLKC